MPAASRSEIRTLLSLPAVNGQVERADGSGRSGRHPRERLGELRQASERSVASARREHGGRQLRPRLDPPGRGARCRFPASSGRIPSISVRSTGHPSVSRPLTPSGSGALAPAMARIRGDAVAQRASQPRCRRAKTLASPITFPTHSIESVSRSMRAALKMPSSESRASSQRSSRTVASWRRSGPPAPPAARRASRRAARRGRDIGVGAATASGCPTPANDSRPLADTPDAGSPVTAGNALTAATTARDSSDGSGAPSGARAAAYMNMVAKAIALGNGAVSGRRPAR